jgi:hypothetical protein
MKSTRRFVSASLLGLIVVASTSLSAQTTVSFDDAEVALWPEYDRASVLVIYRISLPSATAFPVPLSLTLPAAAGVPNAVAEMRDGRLVSLPYERVVDGDTAEVRFAATMPSVQIEYYDPGLSLDGASRAFSYEWPGDYAVRSLAFSVQEPAGATAFDITPPAETAGVGADGLAYHDIAAGPIAVGQTSRVTFSYDKADDRLTAETVPPPAPAATQPATSPPVSSPSGGSPRWTTFAMAGLLILGIVGLVLGLTSRQRKAGETGPVSGSSGRRGGSKKGSGGFCTGCGNRLGSGDRFCSGCGRQAR